MMGRKLGAYEIIERIGKGGMATVYRAYQANVDRSVAVKAIMKSLVGDEHAIHRFQREARLIARLEHPHILPIYDFDGGHEPPYIVMRYLDGGNLKSALKQGKLPLEEVSFLMRQVGSALDYAHRQGIFHRDVKPSNILIDREGNAFVTDFGIARMISVFDSGHQITATGAIVGTPDYMSPEQAMGAENIDHRTDIYALGVILFEMIAGELPFVANTHMGVLLMHMQEPVSTAISRSSDMLPHIVPIIARAMAKNPNERYASVAEMMHDVTTALGGTITTHPTYLRQRAEDALGEKQTSDTTGARTPSEQNKTVTALYANATEYAEVVSEIRGAGEIRSTLTALRQAEQDIIEAQGGVVLSHTDDTVLALWGIDATREDDAERAIRAALEIQDALRKQGADILAEDEEDEPLPLNIGIHTGMALLTPDEQSNDYSASGATISLTSRLTQQAYGSILVTHDTYTHVRGVFTVESDTPLRMRRSRRSVPVYRVFSVKPRAFRLVMRGVEGVGTQMVGRDAELRLLQNAFLDAVEDGETQMITVVSEAGLGKSRLLYEFANWSELRPEKFWIFRGRATPEMTSRPYALLRDLLHFRFQILDSDSPMVARKKLEDGITAQIGSNNEIAHLIGYLAGFDFSDSPYIKGLLSDPQQLTNRARQLFIRWVHMMCDSGPAIFELEDIHHSDSASLDLLTALMSARDDLPIAMICLARPTLYVRRPNWGSGLEFHTRIDLRPLDKRASRNLVREILQKVDSIPKALRDLLVERAEGNPYYLEELVKRLIDDRVIIKDSDEAWRVEEQRLVHLDVPATLVGLLQARLDSLLYPEKLTLQRAAVVGRVFYDQVLEALNTADDTHVEDLPNILARLVERGFIFERETTAFEGCVEYIFSSNMLRDVLLSNLISRHQQLYNTIAAAWLIQVSADRADEYSGLIAELYIKAGENEEAARYLWRAGDKALKISAFDEARQLFDTALELLPNASPVRIPLLLKHGETLYHLGDLPEANEVLTNALESARRTKDGPRIADALYWLSQITAVKGDYPTAQGYLKESLPLARTGDDLGTLARVLYGLGDLHWRLGDSLDDAQAYCEESLALARHLGDTDQELYALNRLGVLAWEQNDMNKARELFQATLERARQGGNRERASTALNNLGEFFKLQGTYEAALSNFREALELAREIGNQQAITVYYLNIAEISILLDNLPPAQQHLRAGLVNAIQSKTVPSILTAVQLAGWMLAKQGHLERGLAYLGLSLFHPASHLDNKRNAHQKLGYLGLAATESHVAAMLEAGKALELDKTVTQLMDDMG